MMMVTIGGLQGDQWVMIVSIGPTGGPMGDDGHHWAYRGDQWVMMVTIGPTGGPMGRSHQKFVH